MDYTGIYVQVLHNECGTIREKLMPTSAKQFNIILYLSYMFDDLSNRYFYIMYQSLALTPYGNL